MSESDSAIASSPGVRVAPTPSGPRQEATRLENETVRVVIEPRFGGKVTSLYDKRRGIEWLWRNPQLGFREAVYGESYVEGLDSGGWDEVFPSVQPCDIQLASGTKTRVPDHGDLVQLPWEVTSESPVHVDMRAGGRCLPFDFRRGMRLMGDELRISYRLRNTGNRPFPWIWCAHPLLPLESIASIKVDAEFRVLGGLVDAEPLLDQWVRLEQLPPRDGAWAVKLFSERGAADGVGLRHESGASLRFSWDVGELPYLALWINNGGWSGTGGDPYFNLGIEPTNAPDDDLGRCGEAATIAAGETVEWSLAVRFAAE